ncbi:hypothetical protein ACFQ6N_01335 [Kitasatospora sp. NPDC056446]|uniref:hypothetical protein n=1 Tax=Kitasatospora sp. NPDC056446 TaxID=3345819 RepID=UPI0036C53A17
MRTAQAGGPGLPVVHEPRVRRCGHYIATITPQEAQTLSHLVLDRNAIQIADAINAGPGRENAQPVTPAMVRVRLNSLRDKAAAQTWVQLVDTACRARLLLPRAELTMPLPVAAVATLRLAVLGHTNQRIAGTRGISLATVGSHLATIRYRMRTRGTPAAVYRLHGVPDALDNTPYCLACQGGR